MLNNAALQPIAVAQARQWSDKRGFHLISDVLSFGRLLYGEPNANGQRNQLRKVFQPVTSCRDARLRTPGNVIETREHAGGFKER